MTAAGSVVETAAPSSRQTVSGAPASGQSARPTMKAVTTVAMTASMRIGAASSRMRRTSLVNAALEDEQREEDVDERLGTQRQIGEQPVDLDEPARKRAVQQNARDRADRRADHGEEHDRRQPQPARERLAESHDDQQAREYGQNDDDIEHLLAVGASAPRPGAAPSGAIVAFTSFACQPRRAEGRPISKTDHRLS